MIYNIIIGLIAVYVIFDAVHSYVTSQATTVWTKLLSVGKESATILFQRGFILFGVGIDYLSQIADFIGAPAVSAALQQYLEPKTLSTIMISTAIITEYARRRKSSLNPIKPVAPRE